MSYQKDVEEQLRDGDIAVVEMRRKTGYLYYRDGFKWITIRNGNYGNAVERGCGSYKRHVLFEEHYIEVKEKSEVPGPIAAVSRAGQVDDEE